MIPAGRLSVHLDEDSGVLVVGGEVDLGTVDRLEQSVRALLDGVAPVVVVDVSGMGFCDSTGVGTFVRLHVYADTVGARMVLRSPTERFRNTLRVTGTDRLLNLE